MEYKVVQDICIQTFFNIVSHQMYVLRGLVSTS